MDEPAIAQIVTDLLAGTVSGQQATEALEELLARHLAPYTVQQAGGYYTTTGEVAAEPVKAAAWRQIWPPVSVWCQQNGGHCPKESGDCKHCGLVVMAAA
jgi:hypothetical protein